MGIRAMFSGVSGLLAHSTWLDVIGNNISNTNTVAYKASRVEFADQINQNIKGALPDTGSYGGVNPVQVGLGTRVASIQLLFTQGVIQQTGNATDIAIEGTGFLLAKVGSETLLTRAGNLTFDGEGNLVDQNGGIIQGWNAVVQNSRRQFSDGGSQGIMYITDASLKLDATTQIQSIHITRDMVIPPKATSVLQLSGNLDSFQQANQPGGILNVMDAAGANPVLPFAMNGIPLNGAYVAWLATAAGTSIQQVEDFQAPTNATAPTEDPMLINLGLKGAAPADGMPIMMGSVSLGTAQGNALNAWQQQPPLPPAHTINTTVYDSLGNARNLTMQFYQVNDLGTANPPVNTPPMSQALYAWYAFDTTGGAKVSNTTLVGGTGITEGDLSGNGGGPGYSRLTAGDNYWGDFVWFNTDGSLGNMGGVDQATGLECRPHIYLPPIMDTADLTIASSPLPAAGAEITDIVVDFGTAGFLGTGKRDGLYSDAEGSYQIVNGVNTYIPKSTAFAKYQNGYTDGILAGLQFDTEGRILGTFTNQQTIAIGQVAIACPNNPEGLAKVGANYYNVTANTGPLYIGKPGTDGTGVIRGNSLESSNVDLTVELSNMIIAQRGFEVNARVIAVTNSTMQTTVQLGQGG